MPAPSLSVLAAKECLKNHRAIMEVGDVGDVPYHLAREILLRIEDPKKLRQIEIASPQICGPDGELWLAFIKRDVPNWDTKPHEPKNPQNWYKVYRKLVQDSEKEIERDAELLKATMAGIRNESDKHKARQVELAQVRLPPGVMRHGPTINVKCDLRERTRTIHNPNEVRAASDRDSQRREAKPAKGKLDKFRKAARTAAIFQQPKKAPSGLWTPGEMKSKATLTNKTPIVAPRGMIEDYRRPAAWQPHDPTVKPPTIFAPRKRRIEHDDAPPAKLTTTEEREKRLKAFTNPSTAANPIPTSKPSSPQNSTSATSTPPPRLPKKNNTLPSEFVSKAFAATNAPSPQNPTGRPSPARPPKQDTTLPREAISKALATTRTPSPQKPTGQPSLAIAPTISRAATSSPRNGGTPPPKRIKTKAPVDIFMRPAKRPRVS